MAVSAKAYCAKHSYLGSAHSLLLSGIGAAVGHAIMPGVGGLLFGALAGGLANKISSATASAAKKRVFVSFDFDHDLALKHLVVGQAKLKESPFSIVDFSLKEAAPEKHWEEKARAAIRQSDLVLVMVGLYTHRARGVLKEVAIARQEGIKVVQMNGYRDRRPSPVPQAGRLYAWSWTNLAKLLS